MKTKTKKKRIVVRSGYFRLQVELRYDKDVVIISEAYEEEKDILYRASTRKKALKLMQTWLDSVIRTGQVQTLFRDGHDIAWKAPELLATMNRSGIGFHVTHSKHRESVLTQGLKANGTLHLSVRQASRVLDEVKPAWIPSWVKREQSVYLYPQYTNLHLTSECDDCDLFAVQAPTEHAWVGSIGIGGRCQFDEDRDEAWAKQHTERIRKEFGPKYWKHSCSYEEYRRSSTQWKRKDKKVELDEVLICESIPAPCITHIGSWKKGVFFPTAAFKDFVRPHLRLSYQGILESYFGPAPSNGASPLTLPTFS